MSRLLVFRPYAAPSTPLPLNVRSAGHYVLPGGSREIRGPGTFLQLFWCLNGSGKVRLGKRFHVFRSNTVFFYESGEKHHLESGHSPLEYRWLTLDGPQSGTVRERFGLKRIQSSGSCPEELFDRLPSCLQEGTARGERKASVIAYEILLLASSLQRESPLPGQKEDPVHQAKSYLEEHFSEARLNISGLAGHFRIHRSTLYRLFVQHHGVTPVQYLNRLRIRQALDLLKEDSLPVADVAVRCGIPDIAYFSRLIRRNTGFSPRAYRDRYS
jgi:AraC-like DNA-binding protein